MNKNDMNKNDNITFFLEEKENENENEKDKDKELQIQQMMNEIQQMMNELQEDLYLTNDNDNVSEFMYFNTKNFYGDNELYYNHEYTVKDLLKICSYYGIEKDIKTSKCKKQDIISTLVYFESLPENYEMVQKRNRAWACITELINDPKMKKYVIWQ